MVSGGLIVAAGRAALGPTLKKNFDGDAKKQNAGPQVAGVHQSVGRIKRSLLAVLLDPRRAQAGKAVLVDGILPGEEFLDGQRITAARLFERQ